MIVFAILGFAFIIIGSINLIGIDWQPQKYKHLIPLGITCLAIEIFLDAVIYIIQTENFILLFVPIIILYFIFLKLI